MKLINAEWERRNIGVSTVELHVDVNDNVDEVENVISENKSEYQVLKLPAGNPAMISRMEKNGFSFIETLFSLSEKVKNIELPNVYRRFLSDIKVIQDTGFYQEMVLEKIKQGEIFKTDRIALDPLFSERHAGNRYYNWAKDEMDKNAELNIVLYKENPVAFSICRGNGKVCSNLLGGNLESSGVTGMGFAGVYASHVYAEKKEYSLEETSVSSNNPSILKLHIMFGFKISDIKYVMVKHN